MGRRRVHPQHWQPGAPTGDVLAEVHVPLPPANPADPDAVLAEVWEEVPASPRIAEAEEIADDIRRLRRRSRRARPDRRPHLRLAMLVATVLIVAIVVLAACGDGQETRTMTVIGTEMAFDAPVSVPAGKYAVTFRNRGAVAHELAFRDPSGQFANRISIPGGRSDVLEVTLEAGTWEIGCFEPGHYEQGMHRPLVVAPT